MEVSLVAPVGISACLHLYIKSPMDPPQDLFPRIINIIHHSHIRRFVLLKL